MTAPALASVLPRLPLASRRLCSTTSVPEAEAHLGGFLWPHRLTLRTGIRHLRFVHNGARFGRIGVHALSYGPQVRISIEPRSEAVQFVLALEGESRLGQRGCEVTMSAGRMCAIEATGPARLELSEGCRLLVLWVEPAALRAAGTGGRRLPGFARGPFDVSAAAPGLARLLGVVCADLDASTPGLDDPAVSAPIEQALYTLLLRLTRADAGTEPAARVPDYLQRVLAYARAHLADPLDLADLAQVAGVSPRALQLAFRRHCNTTPLAWLRERRLELAHAALAGERDSGSSVSAVALDCGFTHLGRFAQQYRERFGEKPSATARRRD